MDNIIINIGNFINIANGSADNKELLVLKEATQANMHMESMIENVNGDIDNIRSNVIDKDEAYASLASGMEFALGESEEDMMQNEAFVAVENWLAALASNTTGDFVEYANGLIAEAQQK